MKTRTATTRVTILAIVLTLAAPAWAAQGDLLRTFHPPQPAANYNFGISVAAMGDNVLVGAYGYNTGVNFQGAAYLFDGTSGALLQAFPNPSLVGTDYFGISVTAVGSKVLVGAPYYNDTGKTYAGAAYLFDGASGALLHTMYQKPKPVSFGFFGWSVAAVGSNVLVGAPDTANGDVYIFDGTSGAAIRKFPAVDVSFGWSVAALGSKVLVGAPNANTSAGESYLFDSASGALIRSFVNPTSAIGDCFGVSVAAVGSNVLVGAEYVDTGASDAGAAYLFDGTTGALLRTFLNPTPHVNDYFGFSVAAVGQNVLIGARGADSASGAVYLFDGATGALLQTFLNPTPAANDYFGYSVAALGNNILIGAFGEDTFATDAGAVYLFEGVPEPATLLLLGFGALSLLSRRRARRMDK